MIWQILNNYIFKIFLIVYVFFILKNGILNEFSKFSDSLNFIEKKLNANYEKLDLKINNIENHIYPNNKNGNYNHNIDINNENFKIKNLFPIYSDNNFERIENDLENNIQKKKSFSNSDNENFFNFEKINVNDLLDDKKSIDYDEDINFNNKRNEKFSNKKVENSDSEFENLYEKEEEYDNIKKYFGEFIFNELKEKE